MHLVLDVAAKEKSAAVKGGEQGDQTMGHAWSIHAPGKVCIALLFHRHM
jgi:hypothetical protein